MKLQNVLKTIFGGRGSLFKDTSSRDVVIYVTLVFLIVVKVLWGFWTRDLTMGDTSSYFMQAVRWHKDGQVNIVWSPLYIAYFGSWLSITENASVATLLHRVGLIVVSTGLVAWLGYVTLPRVLALLLVVWWIALPIHYDTLYEIHLFGAIPILLMAVVSLQIGDEWKQPLLLSIALVTTFLVRNEYVLVIGVLSVLAGLKLFRKRYSISLSEMKLSGLRFAVVFFLAGLLITYFYSVSYVKGDVIAQKSTTKHTLNMCQVFAFGYQQRHSDWIGSAWSGCSNLMQEKFGKPMPTLHEMVVSNPSEVAEHFLWNFSLTRAGLEVLLFNSTGAVDNPDYAPVIVQPVVPTVLLSLTILICLGGTFVIFRKYPVQYAEIREKLARISPLLLAVLVMTIAVILTQRPRPSYLLGAGVLYMWIVLLLLSAFMSNCKKVDSWRFLCAFAVAILLFIPSYQSLPLPSKNGVLSVVYNKLQPKAKELCQNKGAFALSEYGIYFVNYLCSPYNPSLMSGGNDLVDISSLPKAAMASSESLVDALQYAGASALIIDPYMSQKYPNLGGCPELRDAFLKRGWRQLNYSMVDNGQCIAAYIK
jgi:hypothetical protein